MVLFLFVVMMLDINIARMRAGFWRYLPVGAAVGLLLVMEMALILSYGYFGFGAAAVPEAHTAAGYSNTKELGRLLYTEYVYPFQIAAVILLVVIVLLIGGGHGPRRHLPSGGLGPTSASSVTEPAV